MARSVVATRVARSRIVVVARGLLAPLGSWFGAGLAGGAARSIALITALPVGVALSACGEAYCAAAGALFALPALVLAACDEPGGARDDDGRASPWVAATPAAAFIALSIARPGVVEIALAWLTVLALTTRRPAPLARLASSRGEPIADVLCALPAILAVLVARIANAP